jgi:hypothetical protein
VATCGVALCHSSSGAAAEVKNCPAAAELVRRVLDETEIIQQYKLNQIKYSSLDFLYAWDYWMFSSLIFYLS